MKETDESTFSDDLEMSCPEKSKAEENNQSRPSVGEALNALITHM